MTGKNSPISLKKYIDTREERLEERRDLRLINPTTDLIESMERFLLALKNERFEHGDSNALTRHFQATYDAADGYRLIIPEFNYLFSQTAYQLGDIFAIKTDIAKQDLRTADHNHTIRLSPKEVMTNMYKASRDYNYDGVKADNDNFRRADVIISMLDLAERSYPLVETTKDSNSLRNLANDYIASLWTRSRHDKKIIPRIKHLEDRLHNI